MKVFDKQEKELIQSIEKVNGFLMQTAGLRFKKPGGQPETRSPRTKG